MDKKGTTLFILFSLGILFFLLGLALAPPLKEVITESTTTSYLNCTNTSISDQDRSVCTSIDSMFPLFTGVIFGLAGMLLGGIVIR